MQQCGMWELHLEVGAEQRERVEYGWKRTQEAACVRQQHTGIGCQGVGCQGVVARVWLPGVGCQRSTGECRCEPVDAGSACPRVSTCAKWVKKAWGLNRDWYCAIAGVPGHKYLCIYSLQACPLVRQQVALVAVVAGGGTIGSFWQSPQLPTGLRLT